MHDFRDPPPNRAAQVSVPPAEPHERVHLYLPKSALDKLDRIADATGRKRGQVVAYLISQTIEE